MTDSNWLYIIYQNLLRFNNKQMILINDFMNNNQNKYDRIIPANNTKYKLVKQMNYIIKDLIACKLKYRLIT